MQEKQPERVINTIGLMPPVGAPQSSSACHYKPEQKKRKKVAIVGCADSRDMAPFTNPEFEIWGVNNLYAFIPPGSATRWFELHQIDFDGKTYYRRGKLAFRGKPINDYLAELSNLGCPIYMQKQWPGIKNSTLYPLKEILSKYGGYFTNTVSYMIALAIYEGFERIEIYGVDMAVDSEYYYQRPSCEYFIGVARGLGIEVYIPPQADLMKTRFLYGFQEPQETDFELKLDNVQKSMQARLAQAEQQEEESKCRKHQYIGAMSALKEMRRIWGSCFSPKYKGDLPS